MEKVNIDKNIIQINNFISQKEARFLINVAENASEQDWSVYNLSDRDEYNEWQDRILQLKDISWAWNKCGYVMEEILNRVIEATSQHLDNYTYEFSPMVGIYRARKGEVMKPHHDSGKSPKVKYGVVIYLNDDYEGGEIYYPSVGIEIKPKALSLVMHPANQIYRHGVKEVKSGVRYTTTTFLNM